MKRMDLLPEVDISSIVSLLDEQTFEEPECFNGSLPTEADEQTFNGSLPTEADDIVAYLNSNTKPSLFICEEPDDKVRFRYRTEIDKKACTKIRGKTPNSYPKIMISNCPYPVQVCVYLVNGTDIKNKLSLYDARTKDGPNKGNPDLQFYEGFCYCKSHPNDNNEHFIEFNGIGVEIIKLADAKQSLKEDKMRQRALNKNVTESFVPEQIFSPQELKVIDKEVNSECKDYLNCRLRLNFSTSILCPDGNEIRGLIQDVQSMEFTNAKSAAWATPEVVTYAPNRCSYDCETVVIIVLKIGVNKNELAVYIRDANNHNFTIEGRVIELHHKVTLECGIPAAVFGMGFDIEFAVVNKQNEFDEFVWKKLQYHYDEPDIRKRRKSSPRYESLSMCSPASSMDTKTSPPSSLNNKDLIRQRLIAKRSSNSSHNNSPVSLTNGHNGDIESDACGGVIRRQPPAMGLPDCNQYRNSTKGDSVDGAWFADEIETATREMSRVTIKENKSEKPMKSVVNSKSVYDWINELPQRLAHGQNSEDLMKNLIESQPKSLVNQDHYEDGPLHNALLKGNLTEAQFLLSIAVRNCSEALTLPNSSMQTPLHILVACNLEDSDDKVVQLAQSFVSECPDVVTFCDSYLRNSIHYAVIKGKKRLFKILIHALTFIVDPSVINNLDCEQNSPLHYAVIYNHPNLVKQLLSAGADVNVVSGRNGRTPLHLAAIYKREEIAALLLANKDVDINAAQFNGVSVLCLAEENGCSDLVLALTSRNAIRSVRFEEDIDELILEDPIQTNRSKMDSFSSDIDSDAKLFISEPASQSTQIKIYSQVPKDKLPAANSYLLPPQAANEDLMKATSDQHRRDEIIDTLKSDLVGEEFFEFARALCGSSNSEENDEIIGCLKCVSDDCKWDALEDIAGEKLTDHYLEKFLPDFLKNKLKRMDIYGKLFSNK